MKFYVKGPLKWRKKIVQEIKNHYTHFEFTPDWEIQLELGQPNSILRDRFGTEIALPVRELDWRFKPRYWYLTEDINYIPWYLYGSIYGEEFDIRYSGGYIPEPICRGTKVEMEAICRLYNSLIESSRQQMDKKLRRYYKEIDRIHREMQPIKNAHQDYVRTLVQECVDKYQTDLPYREGARHIGDE